MENILYEQQRMLEMEKEDASICKRCITFMARYLTFVGCCWGVSLLSCHCSQVRASFISNLFS
jgi:hypothetical protein